MQPTIPPVEYSSEHDCLEHPVQAIKYYRNRGITEVFSEYKYMGSNAQMLVFKNREKANEAGFDKEIVINSRNGYRFFDDKDIEMKIYDDIKDKLEHDFYIFNGEMLPWILKARDFIKRQFEQPGDVIYLARKYKGIDTKSVEIYRDVLKCFTREDNLQYRIFDVIAYGKVKKGKYLDFKLGMFMDRLKM